MKLQLDDEKLTEPKKSEDGQRSVAVGTHGNLSNDGWRRPELVEIAKEIERLDCKELGNDQV